ncbi:hypothetical protein [Streptomyces sp. NPDC056883]|uniref:hypothetical protein n=1 Tax=Streptomyces sp. NPDC056883 TaxID=3345959 RepID=UPI0036BE39AD
MATVVEQLRKWQAEGGPDLWVRAWERTVRVVEGPLGGYDLMLDGVVIAEGAAGLNTALYLLAAERGVAPEAVTGEQVEELYAVGATTEERRVAWENRLTALGHQLTDAGDPVVRLWREIAEDHRTPEGSYDDTFDFSMTRWGPGYTVGMHKLRKQFSITI